MHRETLKIFVALFRQRKYIRLMLTMEGLEGPNTQDKAERFMAWTGHQLEDVIATCHLSGIAGYVAGKIVQHRFAFRQLWKNYSEEFHRLSSGQLQNLSSVTGRPSFEMSRSFAGAAARCLLAHGSVSLV